MEVRILAIGDVVAKSGLELVSRKLRSIKKLTGADFIVVNGENAAGNGIKPAQARELFDWVLHPKRAPRTFAILLKEEDRAVGNFSLGASPYLEEEPRLAQLRGLSFSLVLNQDYWNRGLMTELLRTALDWTFTHTDLDYVNTGCFSFNGASRRVQEKAGLRLFARSVFERDGKRIPTEEMLLTRADWAADRDGR